MKVVVLLVVMKTQERVLVLLDKKLWWAFKSVEEKNTHSHSSPKPIVPSLSPSLLKLSDSHFKTKINCFTCQVIICSLMLDKLADLSSNETFMGNSESFSAWRVIIHLHPVSLVICFVSAVLQDVQAVQKDFCLIDSLSFKQQRRYKLLPYERREILRYFSREQEWTCNFFFSFILSQNKCFEHKTGRFSGRGRSDSFPHSSQGIRDPKASSCLFSPLLFTSGLSTLCDQTVGRLHPKTQVQ